MTFWRRAQSDECFFQLFIPGLIPVSLLGSKSGFEIVTQLADTGKRPSFALIVYGVLNHFENTMNTSFL